MSLCSRISKFRRISFILHPQQSRLVSAWVNKARADTDVSVNGSLNVEEKFIDDEVQRLLKDLTGLDLEGKVFKERRTGIQQRSHFALMTDERLDKTLDKMREEARHFLHFVPVKEPRTEKIDILSKDDEIAGFDNSKFVFTDITFDATDQDRTVVVREVDGTLRTATPEEHDRMNRTYYHKNNRPVISPPVFEDPHLQNALKRGEHEFVLDWACWFYEPDDPSFIKLSHSVFDRIVADDRFDVLHSTRHFGPFVFYLALNGNIPPLLNHFGGQGRVRDCANLIRLQKELHGNWRFTIGTSDSDDRIVRDFMKQNARFRDKLKDLYAFMDKGTMKVKESGDNKANIDDVSSLSGKATINAKNVSSSTGPLGNLSEEYKVKIAKGGEAESFAKEGKTVDDRPVSADKKAGGKRRFQKPMGSGKDKKKND